MSDDRLFLSPPHLSGREAEEVAEAFASNYIAPIGPALAAFEADFKAYTGFPHAVALTSGTAATHLALRHLDVGPGDEVWAASLTFIGSVGPAVQERATPVFFDCDAATWTLDPDLLAEELADAARVGPAAEGGDPHRSLWPVLRPRSHRRHLREHGVPVICDFAEAMGARYKGRHAGRGAWAAVFSFNGNKIMTTSNGGMLASDDEALIEHARKLSQQAREPAAHYEHTEVGYNYRLSNISGGDRRRASSRCCDDRVERRRAIFDRYADQLGAAAGRELHAGGDATVGTTAG